MELEVGWDGLFSDFLAGKVDLSDESMPIMPEQVAL